MSFSPRYNYRSGGDNLFQLFLHMKLQDSFRNDRLSES